MLQEGRTSKWKWWWGPFKKILRNTSRQWFSSQMKWWYKQSMPNIQEWICKSRTWTLKETPNLKTWLDDTQQLKRTSHTWRPQQQNSRKEQHYWRASPDAGKAKEDTCGRSRIPRGHYRARSNKATDNYSSHSRNVDRIQCPAKPITHAFLLPIDVDERAKYIRHESTVTWSERTNNSIHTCHGCGREVPEEKVGIHQAQPERIARDTIRKDHPQPWDETRVDSRWNSYQNMYTWNSQIVKVSRHWAESRKAHWHLVENKLVTSTVSSRRTRTRNQIESKTTSSLEYAALHAEQEGDTTGTRRR